MVDRSRLPQPAPSRPFVFPSIEKSSLSNGLQVWTITHRAVPLVASALLIRCGSADDPPTQGGLAALAADMLDEGSGDRSAIEMHEGLARVGAHLNAEIDADVMSFGLTTLERFTADGLAVLADMIVRPALRDEDFLRVRKLRQHRLAQLREVPGAVAERVFLRLLYGDHPYGHSPIGNATALGTLSVADVRAFHRSKILPTVATLVAVGDCSHEDIHQYASEAFGAWSSPLASGSTAAVPPSPPAAPRLAVVARPGAPQSELRIGHVAATRHTPDYHALVTANMVLGGQFMSRVNLNLREEKGFTYGARTWFDLRRMPGPFSLQTSVHTAATVVAIRESLEEIGAIRRDRPVTSGEVELARAALTSGYARNFETAGQIARAVGQIARYDLPDDYYTTFVPRIQQVTAEAATTALRDHLHPDRLTTLVVGDIDVIGSELPSLSLGDPVVVPPETF